MDENSPVFENFLNKMRGSRPISESRTNISAEKLVGRPEPKTTKVRESHYVHRQTVVTAF